MASNTDVLDRLLAQLNNSSTCVSDKALNQVISQLIKELRKAITTITTSGGGGGGSSVVNNITNVKQVINPLGSDLLYGDGDENRFYIPSRNSSSPSPVSGDDYVVASDGVTPTPQPINDGAGNFVYIAYTP